MKSINNDELISIYRRAVELQLDQAFIVLLEQEWLRRGFALESLHVAIITQRSKEKSNEGIS
jgi:hypothetical protein